MRRHCLCGLLHGLCAEFDQFQASAPTWGAIVTCFGTLSQVPSSNSSTPAAPELQGNLDGSGSTESTEAGAQSGVLAKTQASHCLRWLKHRSCSQARPRPIPSPTCTRSTISRFLTLEQCPLVGDMLRARRKWLCPNFQDPGVCFISSMPATPATNLITSANCRPCFKRA